MPDDLAVLFGCERQLDRPILAQVLNQSGLVGAPEGVLDQRPHRGVVAVALVPYQHVP